IYGGEERKHIKELYVYAITTRTSDASRSAQLNLFDIPNMWAMHGGQTSHRVKSKHADLLEVPKVAALTC
ncbi:hypothetical protein ACJX0J_018370, partial [Zea mays]